MEKNGLNAPANADYTDNLVRKVAEQAVVASDKRGQVKEANADIEREVKQALFAHLGVNYDAWLQSSMGDK